MDAPRYPFGQAKDRPCFAMSGDESEWPDASRIQESTAKIALRDILLRV